MFFRKKTDPELEDLFRQEDPFAWWRQFFGGAANSGAAPAWTHEPGRTVPGAGSGK